MKIGLDLSVIQTPHRMRGIGATAISFVNNLSPDIKEAHKFIIFLYDTDQKEALNLLDLRDLNYEVRSLSITRPGVRRQSKIFRFNTGLASKLKHFRPTQSLMNNLYLVKGMYRTIMSLHRGNHIEKGLEGIDAFLQFDQLGPLPKSRRIKKARILYDVIPYVMEGDYLWSYKTARAHGDSRKSSLRKDIHRKLYKLKTKAAAESADVLISISEHTKKDFVRYIGIHESRIRAVYLGVPQDTKRLIPYPGFKHFVESSWGYISKPINLSEKSFLLFVGGADPRRRLQDLVAAYNNLKARGYDIRLVLAGDTMKGPYAIPTIEIQKSLATSSYLEDIVFLGFVTEKQKNWLYKNTVAFVYPSVYEGFGLPILEAMQYGAPVITYSNSSISEIAGDAALYVEDGYLGIIEKLEQLLSDPSVAQRCSKAGKKRVEMFMWDTTVTKIIRLLV